MNQNACLVSCHPCARVNPKYLKTHVAVQHKFEDFHRMSVILIVLIGWLYVALMMAVAEGTSGNGTALGAIVTFLLYGVGPVSLVIYLMLEPARKRRRKAQETAERDARAAASGEPDGGSEPAADAVAPVREKP
jgi:hypothetical protein